MLMTTRPQQISHIALRHMGPRHGDEEVLGRYALHFHADGNGSRGSVVNGVVVADSTGHAYAAHLSNGVTFRRCVAHDLVDDAYWWDLSLSGEGRDLVPSHDIVYDRCVAHYVKSGGNSKFNLAGFLMGAGRGNVARGCVATGVEGGSGHRPVSTGRPLTGRQHVDVRERPRPQQPAQRHLLLAERRSPHDREPVHGLPLRTGHLRRLVLQPRLVPPVHDLRLPRRRADHLGPPVQPRAAHRRDDHVPADVRRPGWTQRLRGAHHKAPRHGGRVTRISGSTFHGGRRAQVGLPDGGNHPQLYDFVNCRMVGNNFWLARDLPLRTRLRVIQRHAGTTSSVASTSPACSAERGNTRVS